MKSSLPRNPRLSDLWDSLRKSKYFDVEIRSFEGSSSDWNGTGAGKFETFDLDDWTFEKFESCEFTDHRMGKLNFSSRYRWVLKENSIDVFHCRREHPVFLVSLENIAEGSFEEAESHLCGNDDYRLTVKSNDDGTHQLVWNIKGPKKNDRLVYVYR